MRQRPRILGAVRDRLDQMVEAGEKSIPLRAALLASEVERHRSEGSLDGTADEIFLHWYQEVLEGRLTDEQARAIPGQVQAARDRMLSEFRKIERGPEVDGDNIYRRLAFVFKSSDITGVADLVTVMYRSGLKVDLDQADAFLLPFIERQPKEGVTRRLERLGEWMELVDSQNNDGVKFTPVLVDYLSQQRDFEAALSELERLRAETLRGRFDLDNELQRDLEFKRSAHLHIKIRGGTRVSEEQYAIFKRLPVLPPARDESIELSDRHLAEARRSGYQAACFLRFLRHFQSKTPRPTVVVGNDRYGRQWVVEPLQDYLKDDFTLRYDRVRSHSSFRLRQPYEVERKVREGFPQDFVRELSDRMPHVVIVDARNPIRGPGMMKYARGARGYVNWFMVFNDLRAEGDVSKYEHDSSLPHLAELKKWYEFDIVSRQIKEWVKPGPTYKITHWAPELKEYALLGDFAVPAQEPDPVGGKPLVVMANADIFRTEGEDLHESLRGTHPYYFDGPEKYVQEEVEIGFGEYGLETRVTGPTTDEFVAAVQKEITAEVGRLLESGAVPEDGVIERPG